MSPKHVHSTVGKLARFAAIRLAHPEPHISRPFSTSRSKCDVLAIWRPHRHPRARAVTLTVGQVFGCATRGGHDIQVRSIPAGEKWFLMKIAGLRPLDGVCEPGAIG